MSEDFWFVKAGIALLCLAALVVETLLPTGLAAKGALALAAVILVLDARRDRARDFWRSF
jgi:hypothetical protein